MKNALNKNELFPIIDAVNRLVKKHENEAGREVLSRETMHHRSGHGSQIGDRATKVTPIRGGSPYDPSLITTMLIHYESGAVMTVELIRGASPPVPVHFPDSEYINHVMISGLSIVTQPAIGGISFAAKVGVIRENGYGAFQELQITYA